MYVNVLRGSKLESKLREKPRGSGRSVESIMLQMKRCSSLGDLDLSSGYKGRNVRESYVMAIYKGWGSNLFAVKKFMSQLAFAIQVEEVTITMIQIIQFPQKYVVVYTIWLVTVEKMLAISYLFWWRANARNNISFGTLYRGQFSLSTQLMEPKLSSYTLPPMQHHSFVGNWLSLFINQLFCLLCLCIKVRSLEINW